MLTKTLVDTKTTDPEIAEATQEYLNQMRKEFSDAFADAIENGELPPNADPDRLARRFQANVTALRIVAHRKRRLPRWPKTWRRKWKTCVPDHRELPSNQ